MLKIEELRIKNGFTQEELAKKINVSRQSISEWEKGNSTPNIDNLILLSKILKTSLDYLITGKEESLNSLIPGGIELEYIKLIKSILNENLTEELKQKINEFIKKVR